MIKMLIRDFEKVFFPSVLLWFAITTMIHAKNSLFEVIGGLFMGLLLISLSLMHLLKMVKEVIREEIKIKERGNEVN